MLLGLALSACGPSMQSGASVSNVSLNAAPTAAGDSIVLTLTNGSGQQVGYNLCPTAVEQRVDTGWQAVPNDRVCTMELRTLEPGTNATYTTAFPPGTTAGDYRFAAGVEIPLGGERRTVSSNLVRVAP
jgi:hypothetical protein